MPNESTSNATASTGHLSQQETARLLRLATYASTSVAIFLIGAKLIAWGASDSVSLLATLIDSMLDALASVINLVAVRHALTPADKEHRFGHGKAEALAGLKPVAVYRRLGRIFISLKRDAASPTQRRSNPSNWA